jgi:pyrophosphatase PpaX
MRIDCFIFDFDGTLAHSERAYQESFLHSIRLHTGLDMTELESSDYWNRTPQEVLGRYGDEMLDRMLESFEEHYYANHHNYLAPYVGVPEMLERLQENGRRTAIVSLKPRRAGDRELDITGLRRFIHVSVWGDDVARPKPEPDGVLQAIKELGGRPESTLVVGDSPADIKMGRAAGTHTAAALWGASSKEELLLAASPDLVLRSPGHLLDSVHRLSTSTGQAGL